MNSANEFYEKIEKDWTEYDAKRGKNRLTPGAKKGVKVGTGVGAGLGLIGAGPAGAAVGAAEGAVVGGAIGAHSDSRNKKEAAKYKSSKRTEGLLREHGFRDATPDESQEFDTRRKKDKERGDALSRQILGKSIESPFIRKAWDADPKVSEGISKAVGTQNRMAGMQQTESAMQQNAMQQATEMLAPQVAQQVMQMQQEAEQQFWQEQQQLAMLGQQMNAGTPQTNLNTGPGTQGTYEMGPQLRGPRMSSPPSLRSLSAGPKGPAVGPQ